MFFRKITEKKFNKRITPETYNQSYLLSDCVEGYQNFKHGELSFIKRKIFKMLELKERIRYLEVGFGRGELLLEVAKMGCVEKAIGVDYSKSAVKIASNIVKLFSNADVFLADCKRLPFTGHSFERIFAGDIIEHLSFADAVSTLKELHRVLKPGGFLLVHTSPNDVFVRVTFPLLAPFLRLFKRDLVKEIENHLKIGRKVHVLEHNPLSLKKLLKEVGLFNGKVWVDKDVLRSGEHRFTSSLNGSKIARLVFFLSSKFSIVSFLLGNDLYLKCYK